MIIFGKQPVLYAIERQNEMIETLYVAKDLDKTLFAALKKAGKPIERLDFKKAQAFAKNQNHQGLLAKIRDIRFCENRDAVLSDFAVACVGVTDTGNLGAVIRAAYALGADAVIFSGVKSINLEAVIRTSAGAALSMPLYLEQNPLDMAERFKQAGFLTIGAAKGGIPHKDFSRTAAKRLLVLGAEDTGLSGRLLSKLDIKLTIAMARGFDSLNVSAAAAILIDKVRL